MPCVNDSAGLMYPPGFARGAIPRDYSVQPAEMFAAPDRIKLLPWDEIDDLARQQDRDKSSLEHLFFEAKGRGEIRCLDQNPQGFCWSYSTTMAVMLRYLAMGVPPPRLSAHAVACIIKGFRDEGGWCGLSHEFASGIAAEKYGGRKGVPTVEMWPERSMSRANDRPEVWADAATHVITQDVVDLTHPIWGRDLAVQMIGTLLVQNIPCPTDWREWGHSVCAARITPKVNGRRTLRGPNSWGDDWNGNGWFEIDLQKWPDPMGALAVVEGTI